MHHHPQPHQRRTWGQPQPINFAHDPYGQSPAPYQSQRRSWGQPHPPPRPSMMSNYGPSSSMYGGGDPYYGGPPQHHHHQPPPPQHHHPTSPYNGTNPSPYDPQSFQSGYGSPNYSTGGYQSSYMSPPGQQPQPQPQQQQPSISSPSRTPFRLHDSKTSSSSLRRDFQSPPQQQQPQPQQQPQQQPHHPQQPAQPQNTALDSEGRVPAALHTSIPAPAEDDMAPQNVSFIETEDEEVSVDGKKQDATDSDAMRRLPERLSQLNISSGSKTYRVSRSGGSDAEDPRSVKSPSPSPKARPTISSAFKQNRRGSGGEASGPSSLRSNPKTTEEEEEALANMKTERLKVDKDAAAGFVISFDDDTKPKKPKPELKQRRPSSKRYSMTSIGGMEMASDGSNSSRKENVPPEVMICIVSCIVQNSRKIGRLISQMEWAVRAHPLM